MRPIKIINAVIDAGGDIMVDASIAIKRILIKDTAKKNKTLGVLTVLILSAIITSSAIFLGLLMGVWNVITGQNKKTESKELRVQ